MHLRGRDPHERTGGSRRPLVQEPGRHFLAGARRAGDEHPAARGGDALQRGADIVEDGRGAGQLGLDPGTGAQFLVLALQPFGLGGALDGKDELVRLAGLLDEVVGSPLDSGDGGPDVAVTGNKDRKRTRLNSSNQCAYLMTTLALT